jgi:hypothetical protein
MVHTILCDSVIHILPIAVLCRETRQSVVVKTATIDGALRSRMPNGYMCQARLLCQPFREEGIKVSLHAVWQSLAVA